MVVIYGKQLQAAKCSQNLFHHRSSVRTVQQLTPRSHAVKSYVSLYQGHMFH